MMEDELLFKRSSFLLGMILFFIGIFSRREAKRKNITSGAQKISKVPAPKHWVSPIP
jgi:hypothetical protein